MYTYIQFLHCLKEHMADLVLGHLTPPPWPPQQVHMVLGVRNSMMEVLRLKINVRH